MKKGCFLQILFCALFLPPAQAALEIKVEEVDVTFGTNVRISWSGSLNTSGVTWFSNTATSVSGGVHPSNGSLFGYDPGGSIIDLSQPGMLTPGTMTFGTGTFAGAATHSGLPFGLDGAGRIGVPSGYISGAPLNGEILFPNNNLSFMGIDLSSGPVIWTLPSGDTITMRESDEIVTTVDFDTTGTVGEIVPPITVGDLTITITDDPGDDQEPRIAEYGDDQFYGFAGNTPGVPAMPTAVTPNHYICSARADGGPFAFTTMEFAFSIPVKNFSLSTIDMTKAVNSLAPLLLTALSADGTELAQTVVEVPPDTGNGVVFTLGVAANGNEIHKVRFEGPATGHGIDDLVIIRDLVSTPPPPPSPLKIIAPPAGWDSVSIEDMSDDGTKVVGQLIRTADFTYQAFLWSEEDGFTLLNGLPGSTYSDIYGISGDGNVVLGSTPSDTDPNENFPWVFRDGTTLPVPSISGTEYNIAVELSTDGSVLVGNCDVNLAPTTFANRPALWTWNGSNSTGSALPNTWPAVPELQNLGWLETTSGDGRYAFGKFAISSIPPATYHSYRLDRSDGSIEKITFPTNMRTIQSNQDGSLVLLTRDRAYVYLWEPGTGLEQLSNRPGEGLTAYSYRAIGMSESGDRVLAYEDRFALGSLLGTQIVWWDENRERRNFIETVEAQGIDLTGWTINELDAISSDGTIIAGEALVDGTKVGFLLTLPEGPLNADPVDALLTGPDGFFNPDDGPEITGFDADPDGDGIPNIVEIALASLDGENVVPGNPANASNRPTTTVEVDDPAVPAINLTVVRRHDIPGLSVGMVISPEIDGDWSSDGVTETVTLIDGTWELVTFTAPTGGAKQFARIVVDYPQ